MRKIVVFGLLLSALFVNQGCKECDDPEVKPNSATLKLDIALMNGADPMVWDEIVQVDNVEQYHMDVLKYYLSNITIHTNQGEAKLLKDVVLADASSPNGMTYSFEAPAGVYDKLSMGIGLDSVQNASDPVQFPNEHPLSAAQAMYWSWAMKYRFIRIDGRAKELASDPDYILVAYHPGADDLYRTKDFLKGFELTNGETTTIELKLDVAKWFDGPGGTIDIPTENQSHTTPADYHIALKFTDNFAASLELK